ncbi:MAG TPA: RidA family protein [Acidimicrobiia bacterium]
MARVERHDPFGGAYGAALAVEAGDFMFTSVSGVVALREGIPVFADTFDEQLILAGRHAATELAGLGFATGDIVDAMVFVHPSVEIDPGLLLDELYLHVFGETAPTLTITRAASIYDASLIVIKITAFKSSR